jgi:hypothetical protein
MAAVLFVSVQVASVALFVVGLSAAALVAAVVVVAAVVAAAVVVVGPVDWLIGDNTVFDLATWMCFLLNHPVNARQRLFNSKSARMKTSKSNTYINTS